MSLPAKQTLQETYEQLVSFYDLAEELVDTVDNPSVKNPLAQLDFIEPLAERVEEAADILTEEYRYFAETGTIPDNIRKERIEDAISSIYDVLDTCEHYPEVA